MSNEPNTSTPQNKERYLVFRLSHELYASKLSAIREIVQPLPYRHVPHTVDAFLGIMNLRGEVIGVIDLRKRFGLEAKEDRYRSLLVFSTGNGTIAAVVDKAERVTLFDSDSITSNANVVTRVPKNYLKGIITDNGKLIPVIDLQEILAQEELRKIDQASGE